MRAFHDHFAGFHNGTHNIRYAHDPCDPNSFEEPDGITWKDDSDDDDGDSATAPVLQGNKIESRDWRTKAETPSTVSRDWRARSGDDSEDPDSVTPSSSSIYRIMMLT